MHKMSFREYIWPQNPHTYQEHGFRKAYYVTLDHETYFQRMGALQRVITGEGSFFGEDAAANFHDLMELFENGNPGMLYHPQWGSRYCYFTELDLTQEPKEDCISYRFQFTQALANGQLPV